MLLYSSSHNSDSQLGSVCSPIQKPLFTFVSFDHVVIDLRHVAVTANDVLTEQQTHKRRRQWKRAPQLTGKMEPGNPQSHGTPKFHDTGFPAFAYKLIIAPDKRHTGEVANMPFSSHTIEFIICFIYHNSNKVSKTTDN